MYFTFLSMPWYTKLELSLGRLNIWQPNHKYRTRIFDSITLISKVLEGVICLHTKKWTLFLKVIFYFLCCLFSNKPHNTSKSFIKYQSLFIHLCVIFCYITTTLLTRSMRKQLNKMLQKNKVDLLAVKEWSYQNRF